MADIDRFSIIRILKKFDKDELERFGKFLRSPFHNGFQTLVTLFDLLKPYYPDFNNNKLTRKDLFLKTRGKGPYDASLFNKYMSDLSKLAEEFIVVNELKSDPEERSLLLLSYYQKKNQNELYERLMVKNENENKIRFPGHSKFLNSHRADLINSNQFFKLQYKKEYFKSMMSSHGNLLKYFLGMSSYLYSCMFVQKYSNKNFQDKNEIDLFWKNFDFENFINESSYNDEEKNYLILNYYNVMLTLREDDFSVYRKLKKKLMDTYESLSKQVMYEMLSSLNSHCLVKIAKGHKNLDKEVFNNFKFMLEADLYNYGGGKIINITEYRAILASALKVNETAWAEYFINAYKDYVDPVMREDVYKYGSAFVHFSKGEFERSLKLIPDTKIIVPAMRTDLYFLMLANYFELNYTDLYKSVLDSFRHFLKENKHISKELTGSYMKFMIYYKKLWSLKKNPDDKKALEILMDINSQTHSVNHKNWLIRKFSEQVDNNVKLQMTNYK